MYSIRTYSVLVIFLIATYSFVRGVRKKVVMNSEDYARYRQNTNSGRNRNVVGSRRGSTRDTTTQRAASSGTGNTRVSPFGDSTDIVVLQSGQAPVAQIVNQFFQDPGMDISTIRKRFPWIRHPKPRGRSTVRERRWKVPDFRRLRTTLGLNDYNEFIAQRGLELINGSYKVRVQQKWRGIRCYSSNLVVEQNDYGELYTDTMSGRFLSDIESDIRNHRPRVSEQEAIRLAKMSKGHTNYYTKNEKAVLNVYDRKSGDKIKAVLAYIVNYYVPGAEPVTYQGRTTSRTAVTDNIRAPSYRLSTIPRSNTGRQTGAGTNRRTGSGISFIPGQIASRYSHRRPSAAPSAGAYVPQPATAAQISNKLVSPVNSSRPYVIIDAQNGRVLESWDGLAKAFTWQPQNVMTGNQNSGYKSVSSVLLKDSGTNICKHSYPLKSSETLDVFDKYQNTHTDFNCNDGNTQQYDNTNSAASPRNNVFHWAIKTYTMLQRMNTNFEFPTGGFGLKYEVHHDSFRAEYTGTRILIGDGIPGVTYPQAEPDWVAHETAHVFTEFSSDLELRGESGALSEAFSDMAASALMHQNRIRDPYIIGRSSLKTTAFGGYRDLCNPHNTKMLNWEPPNNIPPRTYDEMIRQGSSEIHLNGAVMGRAFCILSKKSGWNPDQAMRAFLLSNYLYWRPQTTFAEAACSLIKTAKDVKGSGGVIDMADALQQVGVKCSSQG